MTTRRKYPLLCCGKASRAIDPLKPHCVFCGMHLCFGHAEEAEVEGHVFTSCVNCHDTLKGRRPTEHEHCTCCDEEYESCEHHANIGGH